MTSPIIQRNKKI